MSVESWMLFGVIVGGLLLLIEATHGALWLYERHHDRRVTRARARLRDVLEADIRR